LAALGKVTFSFHPEAEVEFNEAIDYYEDKEQGLGYDFAIEVYATIQRIIAFPKAWQVLKGEVDVRWSKDSLMASYMLSRAMKSR
jgi:hypothetical protein